MLFGLIFDTLNVEGNKYFFNGGNYNFFFFFFLYIKSIKNIAAMERDFSDFLTFYINAKNIFVIYINIYFQFCLIIALIFNNIIFFTSKLN